MGCDMGMIIRVKMKECSVIAFSYEASSTTTPHSAAFQLATGQLVSGHAFHADYSDRSRPTAGDRTGCPRCGARYTFDHSGGLRRGLHHHHPWGHHWIDSLSTLLSSRSGARRFTKFLHLSQEFLRPRLLDSTALAPSLAVDPSPSSFSLLPPVLFNACVCRFRRS